MKKITAYLFVLIATFILVAHAVVPHHHHHNEVFVLIENSDCDTDGHKHHADDQHHEHSDTDDSDFCLLKQTISTPVSFSKHEFNSPTFNINFGYFSAILINNDFACHAPPNLSFLKSSFHNSFYTCFTNIVSALRAPPTV